MTGSPASAPRRYQRRFSEAREYLLLAGLLVGVVGGLVLVAYFGLSIHASIRAFVIGEALYSKAQKDAAYHLLQYAVERRSEYFEKYEGAIQGPLGVRMARMELEQVEPNIDRIHAGLILGRNHPADLPRSVFGLRLLRDAQPMSTAFRFWAEADALVFRLDNLAAELKAEVSADAPNEARIQAIVQEVERLNVNLTNLEAAFSSTLADLAREVQRVVRWSIALAALLLLALTLIPLQGILGRLKESQEQFRRLFEQSRDAILLIAPDGGVTYANPATFALFGYEAGSGLARIEHLFARTEARVVFLQRLQQDGAVVDFEATLCRREGSLLEGLLTATRIKNQRGEVVGYETIIRDVTERRQTEERMRLLERAVEASGTGIFVTDAARSGYPLVYVNPAFERMTGYAAMEAIGRELPSLNSGSRPEVLRRALRDGATGRVVVRSPRKDGSVAWNEVSMAPVFDAQGRLVHYVGVQTDVTESKQAEQALMQALARERELNELRARFVAMASHEIRTPLAAILSSAELIERFGHEWSADQTLKHLRRIQQSVQAMTGLLENVLVVGKMEAGPELFEPAPTDLRALCSELVEEVQSAQGRHHHIKAYLPANPVEAVVDVGLLRQALSNLLLNAFKYSPAGSRVVLDLTGDADQAVFRVTDEGVGIPAVDLPRIFAPFHRSSNVETISGTGLGLTIARRAVEMHGGSIDVASEEGEGTAFTIVLPLDAVPVES